MPEKVGKYEIVERIGRGGMGLVFKAHDAILDRYVALKVISTDADITDDLRSRFFREAQACARLSHPNIVTVYDMGEYEGRLFFVMELLEGDELRRLISQRKALALQDKLSIMMQVCDGLHYAHDRGIVHRDIKPGNIMLLRNGQVKILDFGIAQIATAEGGLTRTGLIMGTLRYIAPEQVRGRADHRADIFSVGAVTYELLSLRPPFTGDDPMQLLEQLRTEDPPPLTQVDPTIPPEVAAIVHRAMRKHPGERFQDLEQMRAELEQVQRGLADEAQQVRARLRSQRNRLLQLQASLAERVGSATDDETVLAIDERARLPTMRSLESEFVRRIEVLEARIAQAESLMPALQRAEELLQAGQFTDAVVEFEAIVAEMPEHGRALEMLHQARTKAEEHRRRQIAAQFMQEAQTAFDDGQFGLCLEILKQAVDVSAPAEGAQEFTALRARAEAAQTAQEATRRLRDQADQARDEATRKRYLARAAEAAQLAPELWSAAEVKMSEARAALEARSFGAAVELFNAAAGIYARSEETLRDRSRLERRRAEEAQERATQGQREAVAADAAQLSATLCTDAAKRLDEARAAFGQKQWSQAAEAFDAALVLYRRAENQAKQARIRQREQAEQARKAMAEQRRLAEAVDAVSRGVTAWTEAEAAAAAAEVAYGQAIYEDASRSFDHAAGLYRRAAEAAREIVRALEAARAEVDNARQAAARARRVAVDRQAGKYASEPWRLGELAQAQAGAAVDREDDMAARGFFSEARRHFAAAAEAAGIAAEAEVRRIGALISDARRLLESGELAACRRRLQEVLALKADHAEAIDLDREAANRIRRAEEAAAQAAAAARIAAEAEVRRIGAMMSDARRLLESGELAACRRRLQEVLALKADHAEAIDLDREAANRIRRAEEAAAQAAAAAAQAAAAAAQAIQAPPRAGSPPAAPDPPALIVDTPVPSHTAMAEPVVSAQVARETTPEPRRSARDREVASPQTAPKRRSGRAATVAVAGGCVAIGIGALLFMPSRAPRVTPPTSVAPTAPSAVTHPVQTTRPPEELAAAAPPVVPSLPPRDAPSVPAPTESAKSDASREDLRRRDLARVAQRQAVDARHAAEAADAPKLAAPLWNKAVVAQQTAENALKRQALDQAPDLFAAAENAYRGAATAAEQRAAAEKAAAEKAIAQQLAVADRAVAAERERAAAAERERIAAAERDRVAAAERERVAAAERERVAAAERERAAAAERDRIATAQRQQAEAEQARRAATEQLQADQARRETEARQRQIAMLRTASDDSKARAMSRREQAMKADAGRFAKDVFNAAEAKLAEADTQARGQAFEAASRAYHDAADRYMEAGMRAQGVQEAKTQADGAKARMATEKQRARKESPEFTAALAEERQGNSLYDQLSFKEAAERFRTAEMLFSRGGAQATPKPPPRRAVPPSF
jgi:hypothetical protein